MTQIARPLPVEYLLLDMPAAFPVEPTFTFHSTSNEKCFAVEHRQAIGEIQVCILLIIKSFNQY